MNQIQDPANPDYTAGLSFNYSIWTPETIITMTNVPWPSSYKDVVEFETPQNPQTLDEYIDSNITSNAKIDGMSYARFDQPIRISTPFNRANRFNYVRVENPAKPVPGADIQQNIYYFITGCVEIAPNTTEITVMLDVYQTFGKFVDIGNSYVERGHIGIANTKNFDNYGRDYLTIQEGLDVGGEYVTVYNKSEKIMTNSFGSEGLAGVPFSEPGYDVLVCSTIDLLQAPGTKDDPNMDTATGGAIQGLATGASFYIFNGISGFTNYLTNHKNSPWITQGIISITLVPRIKRYLPSFDYNEDGTLNPNHNMTMAPALSFPTLTHSMFPNWRNNESLKGHIPERYRHLRKFYTYPYMVIEMTTWGATPLVIKPESWANADAKVVENVSIVPPGQRVVFMPQSYNAPPGQPIVQRESWMPDFGPYPHNLGDGDDLGEYWDFATLITNFPTMAILNNGAISYLAANAHGLAFQSSSNDWANQRAMMGVGRDSANAYIGREAAKAQTEQANRSRTNSNMSSTQAMMDQAVVGGIQSVTNGVIGGATGGPGGMVVGGVMGGVGAGAGGVGAAINTRNANNQTVNANNQASRSTDIANEYGLYEAQNNARMATRVNAGDYKNSQQALQAKIQDANLIQPTVSGQMGGEVMNLVMNQMEVQLRWKLIDPAAIAQIGEFWLRYGYPVMRYVRAIPSNFIVMTKFTYWKMSEVYVTSAPMPEIFKNTFRAIFEGGVTVWVKPEYIGNIDMADNQPLPGITL